MADQTTTIEVPKEAPAHRQYSVEGTGYEPGVGYVVLLEHSPSGWHRRRDVQADEKGTIRLSSNAYEEGMISVRVLSTGENVGTLATAKIKVVPAPADDGDEDENDSVEAPTGAMY